MSALRSLLGRSRAAPLSHYRFPRGGLPLPTAEAAEAAADVKYADTNRPFVSFMADGNYYFVDTDRNDKTLLARLTPQKAAHESAFKNL